MGGQVQGVWMRVALVAVIAMGVLILVGVTTVGVVIVRRVLVQPPAPVRDAVLDEPVGTRIAGISALTDRVALRLEGGGPDRVVVVDLRTGQVVGRAGLAR